MATKEQIKEWKKEHGSVIEFPFENEEVVFFKPPNRKNLKLIMSKGQQGPIAMSESFVRNCYLGGDVKVSVICGDNTSYIAQVAATIDDLLGTKKAQIKKH